MTSTESIATASTPPAAAARLRVGVVSYLNTLPLIDGLEPLGSLELEHAVPSRLLDMLLSRRVEMALCSVVDYQKSPEPLRIVPVGMLGCRGATMTVRLYSRVPISRVAEVHADCDSHTSVILLQVLLRERHGLRPRMIPLETRDAAPAARPESMLLIGDKVITSAPPHREYPHQLDLGEAWFETTGRPFVFATWMCRRELGEDALRRVRTAAAVLDRQRRHNRLRTSAIVHRHAIARGWPKFDAERYLTSMLRYELGEEERAGLETFFRLAHGHELLPRVRPLEFLEGWRHA